MNPSDKTAWLWRSSRELETWEITSENQLTKELLWDTDPGLTPLPEDFYKNLEAKIMARVQTVDLEESPFLKSAKLDQQLNKT